MRLLICLGIESTSHTFAASISSERGPQSDVREVYSPPSGMGIHPRLAAQHHSEVAAEVVQKAIETARFVPKNVDGIAFSAGPGLGPCLRVGATVARAMSVLLKKPLVAVHHAIGHIEIGVQNTGFENPLTVLVSGGHTAILALTAGRWRVYGETEDITLGNLLDVFARQAGLSHPGGPSIERLAMEGRPIIDLPYVVKGNDVSYSGLLTEALRIRNQEADIRDLCCSLQETAFSILVEATERSLVQTGRKELLMTGGVAANKRLQALLNKMCELHETKFGVVRPEYSGDCGAQISWTGLRELASGIIVPREKSFVRPKWRLDEVDIRWGNMVRA